MKKQTKHSIKAHLLWSALILLSLLAVCAIPFALAQSRSRGTAKQSVAKPNAVPSINLQSIDGTVSAQPQSPKVSRTDLPTTTSGPNVPNFSLPPVPKLPAVTLYDQYNNAGTNATVSQDFETANDTFDDQLADDFV